MASTRTCRITGEPFEVGEDDIAFYERLGVPVPDICPEERARQMLATANHRNLYLRQCAATGKRVVTYYPPSSPVPVFDIGYWYSDKWDQHRHGRDFNFNRPFFEQFHELMLVSPRPNTHRNYEFDENSEYTNYAGHNKNCYLIFDSDHCWECLYSYSINNSRDCLDCFRVEDSELCCECVDCVNCYQSRYLQNCANCGNSAFLRNCIGCNNCCFCVNLKNKQHYLFNKRRSPEDYARETALLRLDSRKSLHELRQRFFEYSRSFPARATEGVLTEDCFGDYLTHCKNARYCFDSRKLWDCKYFIQGFEEARDCMDCIEIGGESELCFYSSHSGTPAYFLRYTSHAYPNASYLTHCYYTPYCHHCFGCCGLHHAKYCILNKRCSKDEYEALMPKIIEHMKDTGEWGSFFPPALSPFPYNISAAQDYMPLGKDEALRRGYTWEEADAVSYQPSTYLPPDTIDEVTDDILSATLACRLTGKNYRIQRAELAIYRKTGLPVPDLCFDVRHTARLQQRNPRKLHPRKCARCGKEVLSTVPPDREVLCEKDFQDALE